MRLCFNAAMEKDTERERKSERERSRYRGREAVTEEKREIQREARTEIKTNKNTHRRRVVTNKDAEEKRSVFFVLKCCVLKLKTSPQMSVKVTYYCALLKVDNGISLNKTSFFGLKSTFKLKSSSIVGFLFN